MSCVISISGESRLAICLRNAHSQTIAALSESQLSPKVHYLSDVDVKKLLDTADDMTRLAPDKGYLRDIILFALNKARLHLWP